MKISYNWLKEYIPKLSTPEKLAEILTSHSFEVEEIKKVRKDWVLDIDILPNRAHDCLSHFGIARECATLLNAECRMPNTKLKEDKKLALYPRLNFKETLAGGTGLKIKDFLNLEVKNKDLCSRYTARIITNVKVGPSPKWLKDRLGTLGYQPINNVVDATNYVMLETGQPLHAFDLEKVSGIQNQKSKIKNQKLIIVRKAKGGEGITTLDGKKYDLDENILVIADSKEPLAIAGIKGGKKAEISKKTKNIILESANFNPLNIRRSSKKLNLKTDSSWRFENQIDPNLTLLAINRVAVLIQKIAGGKVVLRAIDVYPEKISPKIIKLDLNYVEKLLGLKIPEKEIKRILEGLGLKIENLKLKILNVVVPTFRPDISIPEDLIEEIARIYGYQKIPNILPQGVLVPSKRNEEIFWEDFSKNILKEAGFSEVYNYSFVGEKEIKIFDYDPQELIEIENPISLNQGYLRPNLICNILKNIKENLKNFEEARIFELGRVFNRNKKSREKIREKRMLTGALIRKKTEIKEELFYEAKGVIDLLLNGLGIAGVWYQEYKPTPENSKMVLWSKNRSAEIKIGRGEEIGFLGEINQNILRALEIKYPVLIFDIDFEKLQKLASEESEYRPFSQHPAAIRDIAVLVPQEVLVEEVLGRIETAGGKLVRDVDVFDIYEGEELPAGKKNFAFHIVFQAEDRTLTPEEINSFLNAIIIALEEDSEWEVRK